MTEASQAMVDRVLEVVASQPEADDFFGESLEEDDDSGMGSASEQELLNRKVPRQVPLTDAQKHEASLAHRRERDQKKRERDRAQEGQALPDQKAKKGKSSKNDKPHKKGKSSKNDKPSEKGKSSENGKSSKKTKKNKRSSPEPVKPPKKTYKVTTGELNAFMVMLGNEIVDNAAVPQKIAQALNLARALNLQAGDVADTKRIRTARAAARELKGADIVLPTPEEQKRFYRAIRQTSKEGDYNRYLELSIKKKYAEAAWPFVYEDVTGEEFERKISTFGDMDVPFGDEKPDEDPLAKNVINAHFEQTSGKHSGPDGDWISLKPLQQQQQQRPPGQQQRPKVGTPRSENPYYPYALMFLHEWDVVGTTKEDIFKAVNSGLTGTDFVAVQLTAFTFGDYKKTVVADLNSGTINFPLFEYQTRVYNALRGHALDDTTIYRAKIVQAVKQYELAEAGREVLLEQIMGEGVEIAQSEISGDAGEEGRDIVAYTIVGLHLSKAFPTVKGPTFVALVEELKQEKPRAVAPRSRPSAAGDVVDLTGSEPGTTSATATGKSRLYPYAAFFVREFDVMQTKNEDILAAVEKGLGESAGVKSGTFIGYKKDAASDIASEKQGMPLLNDQVKIYNALRGIENDENGDAYKLKLAQAIEKLAGSPENSDGVFDPSIATVIEDLTGVAYTPDEEETSMDIFIYTVADLYLRRQFSTVYTSPLERLAVEMKKARATATTTEKEERQSAERAALVDKYIPYVALLINEYGAEYPKMIKVIQENVPFEKKITPDEVAQLKRRGRLSDFPPYGDQVRFFNIVRGGAVTQTYAQALFSAINFNLSKHMDQAWNDLTQGLEKLREFEEVNEGSDWPVLDRIAAGAVTAWQKKNSHLFE
jgi:hypothetical protein